MHRPSESLMNEFYNIAECNTEKRLSAVANFVQTEVSYFNDIDNV